MQRTGPAIIVFSLLCTALLVIWGGGPTSGPDPAVKAQDSGAGAPERPTRETEARFTPNQIVVRPQPGVSRGELARILSVVQGDIARKLPRINAYVVKIPSYISPPEAARRLAAQPDIKYSEPNYIVRALSTTPSDPYYSTSGSWGQSYEDLWGLHKIDAGGAWDTETGDSSVVVAVVDTGLDFTHADMQANVWSNPGETGGGKESNGLDDDGNGYPDDYRGWNFYSDDNDPTDDNNHGTHVAGTIAADSNNAVGVTGACWECKVMPLKFLNFGGFGDVADGADSITYAADNGANVINLSWGGAPATQVLEDAIDYATSLGVVVVAAAGNDSEDPGSYYPAAYDGVIAVAASDDQDERASFTNYGSYVDVSAPGVDILSLQNGGGYVTMDGTSMASPLVAGSAAVLLSQNPTWTYEDVTAHLMGTADNIDALNVGYEGLLGMGRINLLTAVTTERTIVTRASTTPSSPDGDSGWFVTQPTVTLTPTETGTTQYQWGSSSDSGWSAYSSPLTPDSGTNTLYYRSIDASGVTEDVRSTTYKVDTGSPVDPVAISSSHSVGWPITDDTIETEWTLATDDVSGLDGYRLEWGISTEAIGTFLSSIGSSGSGEGEFNLPFGVAVDASGDIYVADTGNDRVQKIDASGSWLATIGSSGSGSGEFDQPSGVAIDVSGDIYVTDTGNDRIQRFDSSGSYEATIGTSGSRNGEFDAPTGIAVDPDFNMYVADTGNDRIQKLDLNGTYVLRLANTRTTPGQFRDPYGVAVDSSGNIYVGDTNNDRIQKYDSAGTLITTWGDTGARDGLFMGPGGIVMDASDNLYVADLYNDRIQKFDDEGNFLDSWGSTGTGDAQFDFPTGVAVSPSGEVYVADYENHRIQGFYAPRHAEVVDDTTTATVSPSLPDGSWYFTVTAYDVAGNTSSAVNLGPFDIGEDTIPITTLSASPLTPDGFAGWYLSSPSVTLESDQAGTTQYQWNSSDDAGWTSYTSPFSAPEGPNKLYFRSIDTSGNTEDVRSQDFMVDSTDPTDPTAIGADQTVDTWLNSREIDAYWSGADDASSGVAGYALLWDQTADSIPVPGLSTTDTSVYFEATEDAAWYLHLSTCDIAGNCTSTVHLGPFKIDTAAPAIVSTTPLATTGVAITTTVDAVFDDDMSADSISVDTFTLRTSAGRIISGSVSYDAESRSATFTPTSNLAYSKAHTATISADVTDKAGNPMAADYTWTFTTDAAPTDTTAPTAPTLTASAPDTTSIQLNWTPGSDDVRVTRYVIFNGDTDRFLAAVLAPTRTKTFTGLTPDAYHSFYVQASDAAKNISDASNMVRLMPTGGGDTPVTTGDAVTVAPSSEVSLTYSTVDVAGTTTVTTTSGGGAPPSGFMFRGNRFEISTTATYSGTIIISVAYDPATIVGPEATLKLFHWEGGAWTDVTTHVDTVNDIIYGEVTSLSPFALGSPELAATGGSMSLFVLGLLLVFGGASITLGLLRNTGRI